MKFLLTVAAVIAATVAVPTQRGLVDPGTAGPAPVPDAEPGFGPAPAPIVEPGFGPAPIPIEEPGFGPALVDSTVPVAIGPAFIDSFEPAPVAPETNVNTPIVQIILNINHAAFESNPISPGFPAPIIIDEAVVAEPIQIIDVPLTPVQVVEAAPVAIDPIGVGTPVVPSPAVVLPEELN